MMRVILPRDNEKDLVELPQPVCDELEILFARHLGDVIREAIPALAQRLTVQARAG